MPNLEHRQTFVGQQIRNVREDLRGKLAQGRLETGVGQLNEAIRELHLQQFDLHYAAQNFPACAKALQNVGDYPQAYERWVYLRAHAEGYRDEKALMRLVEELGRDNTHAVTAMALAACMPGSEINASEVYRLADEILRPRDVQYASASDAYLLLSCGKLALAQKDFERALGYLEKADKAYPAGGFSYRRVELQLCRADAFESQGDLWSAFEASSKATAAAHEQLRLESGNPQWARLERLAKERRNELEAKNFQDMHLPEV